MNKNSNILDEIRSLKEMDYALLDVQHTFMVDGVLGGFKAAINKLHYTFVKQVMLGILSGLIIGFGYYASVVAMVSLPESWASIGGLLLGFMFPGCIILITFLGGGLFTSHVFSTIPVFKGCASTSAYMKGIFGVLIGNFAGTLIFVTLIAAGGGLWSNDALLNKVFDMSIHKLYLVGHDLVAGEGVKALSVLATIGIGIASGTLCNVMVCSTLPLTSSTKSSTTTYLLMIFPIAFFVIGGFQHGPANSFFLWYLLFEIIFIQDTVTLDGLKPEMLHFVLFIVLSSIPTLIGNWIGGALLLPGILYVLNKEYASLLFNKLKLEYLEEKIQHFKEQVDIQMKATTKRAKEKKAEVKERKSKN